MMGFLKGLVYKFSQSKLLIIKGGDNICVFNLFIYEVEEHFIEVQQENELNVIGTSVRILLDQSPFKKTAPVWSSQVYTISDFHNSNYELDDVEGYYNFDELQPINEDFVMNTKVKTDE